MPTDFLPEITYPMIKVYVTWHGATPEELNDNIADPMAVAVIGGLHFSLFVTLFLLPNLYFFEKESF